MSLASGKTCSNKQWNKYALSSYSHRSVRDTLQTCGVKTTHTIYTQNTQDLYIISKHSETPD